jgi:hypothetical protein
VEVGRGGFGRRDIDVRRAEAAHDQLLEQYEILETRLALAEDESDRLSQVNAELISHGNGLQRISYVEGVRREMSLIKQVSCSLMKGHCVLLPFA